MKADYVSVFARDGQSLRFERVTGLEARAEASETVSDLAFKTATRCATRDDVAAEAAQRDTVDTRLGHRVWLLEREYPVRTGR